jgi:hypothetical protein
MTIETDAERIALPRFGEREGAPHERFCPLVAS